MKYLRTELEKSIEITDEEWKYITSKFKPKSAKKAEIVHYTGDIFLCLREKFLAKEALSQDLQ